MKSQYAKLANQKSKPTQKKQKQPKQNSSPSSANENFISNVSSNDMPFMSMPCYAQLNPPTTNTTQRKVHSLFSFVSSPQINKQGLSTNLVVQRDSTLDDLENKYFNHNHSTFVQNVPNKEKPLRDEVGIRTGRSKVENRYFYPEYKYSSLGQYIDDCDGFLEQRNMMVFRKNQKDPYRVFQDGWSARGDFEGLAAYSNLFRHSQSEQGRGSMWLSTSYSLSWATSGSDESYGRNMYVLQLEKGKSVVLDKVLEAKEGKGSSFYWQYEIAVQNRIKPSEVKYVVLPQKWVQTVLDARANENDLEKLKGAGFKSYKPTENGDELGTVGHFAKLNEAGVNKLRISDISLYEDLFIEKQKYRTTEVIKAMEPHTIMQ